MKKKDLLRIGFMFLIGAILLYMVNSYFNKKPLDKETFYIAVTNTNPGSNTSTEEEEDSQNSSTKPSSGSANKAASQTSNVATGSESFIGNFSEVNPSDGFSNKFTTFENNVSHQTKNGPNDCFTKDQ